MQHKIVLLHEAVDGPQVCLQMTLWSTLRLEAADMQGNSKTGLKTKVVMSVLMQTHQH